MIRRGIRAHRGLLVNTYLCEFIPGIQDENIPVRQDTVIEGVIHENR